MQRRATASLCTSCACLMQASIDAERCAMLQKHLHSAACLTLCTRLQGNHRRHGATASLCRSCACLTQASIGTMKCAMLQKQQHATACHCIAVYKPKHYKLCAKLQAQPHTTACRSIAVYKQRLPSTSQHRHNEMCVVAEATACCSVPENCCVYKPKAGQIVCQGAKATACDSMPQHCCANCACHTQASIGTMECAMLHEQPCGTACLSIAVYEPRPQ